MLIKYIVCYGITALLSVDSIAEAKAEVQLQAEKFGKHTHIIAISADSIKVLFQ